ncbi:carbamoyl-phosphate synthase L chain, ATP binding domain-containing protein [Gongronella butleri]|nr:carbamoyl-phosphate synthase L chain, ATP binding domain-containing protein [Gongronella butleri]
MVHVIKKILIANRGEIACRVIKTSHKLGIATVAIFSDSDENSLFVRLADEAYRVGPSVAADSYLNGDNIIAIAQRAGADAIHPGYGFLSENADFADKVKAAGIIFIGPAPDSIRTIGDKIAAKNFLSARASSIPLIPGYNGDDQSVERLVKEASSIDFPILLKASAGGGGRGMRAVYEESKLTMEIEAAQGEALRSFGSDKLLVEKYFESIRHVEVQIFGDQYGNVYHIGERDCSVQRRHQKVVEETPSPAVDAPLRKKMTDVAIEIGRMLNYEGAGTVEFILDEKTKKFYFLELNTRLQVEHPITEYISGLDLVELQILVAQGQNLAELGLLDNIEFKGHAIEVRLCAEDPDNNFSPRTGVIQKWHPMDATGPINGVRFDTGVVDGSEISVYYDSMIAKVIVHAPTRQEAVQKMITALSRTVVLGITTNQKFLLNIMKNARFQGGIFDTNFIPLEEDKLFPATTLDTAASTLIATALFDWSLQRKMQVYLRNIKPGWRNVSWGVPSKKYTVAGNESDLEVFFKYDGETSPKRHTFQCAVAPGLTPDERKKTLTDPIPELSQQVTFFDDEGLIAQIPSATGIQGARGLVRCLFDGVLQQFYVVEKVQDINDKVYYVHDFGKGHPFELSRVDRLKGSSASADDDRVTPYTSSMPCRVLKVLTPSGTAVSKHTPIMSVESMKTEIKILSQHEGIVTVHVKENQLVDARVLMCQVDDAQPAVAAEATQDSAQQASL